MMRSCVPFLLRGNTGPFIWAEGISVPACFASAAKCYSATKVTRRPQTQRGNVATADRARQQAQKAAELKRTSQLLARSHVERWFGKRGLLVDPTLLRALVKGDGWVKLESICTIPKILLLRFRVPDLVESLQGSGIVELSSHCSARAASEEWHLRPAGVDLSRLLRFIESERPRLHKQLDRADEGALHADGGRPVLQPPSVIVRVSEAAMRHVVGDVKVSKQRNGFAAVGVACVGATRLCAAESVAIATTERVVLIPFPARTKTCAGAGASSHGAGNADGASSFHSSNALHQPDAHVHVEACGSAYSEAKFEVQLPPALVALFADDSVRKFSCGMTTCDACAPKSDVHDRDRSHGSQGGGASGGGALACAALRSPKRWTDLAELWAQRWFDAVDPGGLPQESRASHSAGWTRSRDRRVTSAVAPVEIPAGMDGAHLLPYLLRRYAGMQLLPPGEEWRVGEGMESELQCDEASAAQHAVASLSIGTTLHALEQSVEAAHTGASRGGAHDQSDSSRAALIEQALTKAHILAHAQMFDAHYRKYDVPPCGPPKFEHGGARQIPDETVDGMGFRTVQVISAKNVRDRKVF